ncbi:MAG: RNA 2',3'-cyclic phosphodiesterase [Candidatus Micrarchaeia archaeon]
MSLDQEISKNVLQVYQEFKKTGIRMVNPDSLHITLAFLGNISLDEEKGIERILDLINARKFVISIKGIGCFSETKPQVVFAKIEKGIKELNKLHDDIFKSLGSAKVLKEAKKEDFIPHITLGRVRKHTKDIDRTVIEICTKYKDLDFGSMNCKNFALIKSSLTKDGPIYEDLYKRTLEP